MTTFNNIYYMFKLLALPIYIYKFVRDVVKIVLNTRVTYLSASISHFMILSMIPFLFLVMSILGYISQGADTQFSIKLINYIETPVLKDSIQKIIEFSSKYRKILGLIGILILFWTSKNVVFALDYGLNAIMGTASKKKYYRKLIDTLLMILIVLCLFGSSMVLLILASYVNAKYLSIAAGSSQIIQQLWLTLGGYIPYVFSLVMATLLFYSIYLIIPIYPSGKTFGVKHKDPSQRKEGKMPYRQILLGAVCGAVIWQIISTLFSWYLSRQTIHYQIVYGSMAAFIFIILWVYLFAISILIGGAVIKVAIDRPR